MQELPEDALPSASQNSPSQSNPEDAFTLLGKRIIIVEDEGITQMQLRRSLTKAGLQVVATANNGQTAVEVVLRERPDLVLMDIRMPIMDGLEAARRILQEYRVCIVMLTAFATEEYQEKAKELGACGYIHKPIITATLFSELQEAYSKFQTQ
jgi:two-component system, response regulator PdtaR